MWVPPFKPHPWSRTEPKIVPMTTLFGALSGSTAFPAFFLWLPSFSSRFSYVFSSLYISPATTFSPALHLSGHYTSPTPTFLWPLHFLQPLHFSGHYNFFLSLATFFLWLLLFSGHYISLATTLLWSLLWSLL
jgi:hypothetical protein